MEHRLWLQGTVFWGGSPKLGELFAEMDCIEVVWVKLHPQSFLEQDFDVYGL